MQCQTSLPRWLVQLLNGSFGFLLAFSMLSPAMAAVDWVAPDGGISIATDASDNVFTINYDYVLGGEISLTKRDKDGNLLWTVRHDQTDSTKWEQATWVATDGNGNIFVTGTLMSGYSNPVSANGILMKFSPDGVLLWRKVFDNPFDGSTTRKCLVDSGDNVYVFGKNSGPAGLVSSVKKFAADGTPVWTYYDADGIGAPNNIKITPDGYLLVSGVGNSRNGYSKIDLQGNKIWSSAGIQSLTVGDAAGDLDGNSYLVNDEYTTTQGSVISKLDPTGATIWSKTYPLTAFRIDVGNDNQAVASGFPNTGSGGAAFIKVNPAGDTLWSNLDADGPLGLLLHAQMLLDDSNAAYLAAGTLFEMAVCKVNADGSSAWTQTVSGSYANAMALGRFDGHVFVTGGNTARLSNPGIANQPPLAAMQATPVSGTAPLLVSFSSAGSSDPDGGALSYAWEFGDGGTSSEANPSHTYQTAGTYTARLTVTDVANAQASASSQIVVSPAPLPSLISSAIRLSAVLSGSTLAVTGNVTVKDSAGLPVKDALVNVTWRKPGNVLVVQSLSTNRNGLARFTTSGARGTYMLTVNDISKSGWVFDNTQGVLSATIRR
jgi:hypothetical protein